MLQKMNLRAIVGSMAAAIAAIGLAISPAQAQSGQPIKIGFSMALTGPLAGAGKGALLGMKIWQDDINKKGGMLGRPVQLVFYDDKSAPAEVPGIYTKLIDVDKVDLIMGPYATTQIAPAIPVAMQKNKLMISLFGTAVNSEFKYNRYFSMIPTGPNPKPAFTAGFFETAMAQNPKPQSIAIVAADAEFGRNVCEGARDNSKKAGLRITYDRTYPPSTTDFAPIVRAIQATNPEVVFVASYPPDSAGMVRAANEVGLKTRMFGGGLVGPQFAALKTQLGPLLNGVVNYEFYVPDLGSKFPFLDQFLAKYQARAVVEKVDPLGFYLPPYAYAMMQVLDQAITATKSLDQAKLAQHIHKAEFDTYVGKVRFAGNGEWAAPRVMMTQYHGIKGNDVEQFKKPGRLTVLSPREYKTGDLKAPYHENRK